MADATARLRNLYGGGARAGLASDLPHLLGHNCTTVMEDWGLEGDDTGVIMMALIMRASEVLGDATLRAAGDPNVLTIRSDTDAGNGVNLVTATIGTSTVAEHRVLFRKIEAAYVNAGGWLYDLTMAEQVTHMTFKNVESYFAQYSKNRIRGRTILTLITPFSTKINRLCTIDGVDIPNTTWMRYRMSASSSAQLVKKAMDIVGAAIPNLISPETVAAVNASLTAPYNLALATAISVKSKAFSHAVLTAFKSCPDSWWQGEKAKDETPALLYNVYLELGKKLLVFGGNIAAIRDATTMAELVAAVPANALGV